MSRGPSALTLNAQLTRLANISRERYAAERRADRRAAATLVEALADADAATRAIAGWALAAGKTGRPGGLSPRALERLIAMLRHQTPDTRRWAAFILGRMREKRAEAALRRARRDDPKREVRAAARDGLASLRRAWVRRKPKPDDLVGHRAIVGCIALSSDGRLLVSAGWDGTVRLWDLARGRPTWIFAREGRIGSEKLDNVHGVALSPDDRVLAIGTRRRVVLVDVRTGATLKTIDVRHEAIVYCGTVVQASGGSDRAIRFLDARGRTIRRLRGSLRSFDVACSLDGRWAAFKSRGWTIVDVKTGEKHLEFPQGTDQLSFSPDSKSVAVAYHGQGDLWNLDSKTLARSMTVPRDQSTALVACSAPAFSPSGDRLALGQGVWQIATGTVEWLVPDPLWTRQCLFSPDGKQLACAGDYQSVILRDAATGREEARFGDRRNEVRRLAATADGAVSAEYEDGIARVWKQGVPATPSTVPEARFQSPDGRLVATFSGDGVWIHEADQSQPARQLTLPHEGDSICSLAFSPDGACLAAGANGFYVAIWDTATWQVRSFIDLFGDGVHTMAFSPDGKRLAIVTSYSADVEVRDVVTGALVGLLEGHVAAARAVSYMPDGSTIVTGAADGTVRLWDARTSRLLDTWVLPRAVV